MRLVARKKGGTGEEGRASPQNQKSFLPFSPPRKMGGIHLSDAYFSHTNKETVWLFTRIHTLQTPEGGGKGGGADRELALPTLYSHPRLALALSQEYPSDSTPTRCFLTL